jgi:hypothetical protein
MAPAESKREARPISRETGIPGVSGDGSRVSLDVVAGFESAARVTWHGSAYARCVRPIQLVALALVSGCSSSGSAADAGPSLNDACPVGVEIFSGVVLDASADAEASTSRIADGGRPYDCVSVPDGCASNLTCECITCGTECACQSAMGSTTCAYEPAASMFLIQCSF